MSNNLVETIQKNLGLPALRKIDPNIQEAKENFSRSSQEKTAQAAIPAVLTALYNYTRSDEGCEKLIATGGNADWLNILFGGKEALAVEKVAHYASVPTNEAEGVMENVADEAVIVVKNWAGENPAVENIRAVLNAQRHNILVSLPAAMKMGDLLNEETLDDRTNKMEGPVSSFLHRIENILSEGDQSKYP